MGDLDTVIQIITVVDLVLIPAAAFVYRGWQRHKAAMHRRLSAIDADLVALRERNDTQHADARVHIDARFAEISACQQEIKIMLGRIDERHKALDLRVSRLEDS